MLSPVLTPLPALPPYFENAAGQVREHPAGYAVVCYAPGPRARAEFEALLAQLGQLLLARGWARMLSDQRLMAPFTDAEKAWTAERWLGQRIARPTQLWVAMLGPTDVFTRLSVSQVVLQAAPRTINYQAFPDEAAAHAYLSGLGANPVRR